MMAPSTSRQPARQQRSLRETISLAVWLALMLVWVVAWVLGVWWVLPVVARLEFNADLIGGVFWLVTGAIAWMVAFSMGYRRYWTR